MTKASKALIAISEQETGYQWTQKGNSTIYVRRMIRTGKNGEKYIKWQNGQFYVRKAVPNRNIWEATKPVAMIKFEDKWVYETQTPKGGITNE